MSNQTAKKKKNRRTFSYEPSALAYRFLAPALRGASYGDKKKLIDQCVIKCLADRFPAIRANMSIAELLEAGL